MDNSIPSLPLTYACIFAAGMGVSAMAQGRHNVVIEAIKVSSGRFSPDCCEPISCVPDPVVIEAGRLALKFTRDYRYCSWSDSIRIPKDSSNVVKNAKALLLLCWPDVAGLAQILFDTTKNGSQSGSYRLIKIGLTFEDYPAFLNIDVDEGFEETELQ